MECLTISSFTKKGKAIKKPKKKHETFYAANIEAFRINSKKNIFIKRVAYECGNCGKFHVGTTFEMLNNKKAKTGKYGLQSVRLKIIGTVDLSLFSKKDKGTKIKEEVKEKINTSKNIKAKKSTKKQLIGQVVVNTLTYRYYVKIKVVKIITPEGTVRMIKFKNIPNYGKDNHNKRCKIKEYIINNTDKL